MRNIIMLENTGVKNMQKGTITMDIFLLMILIQFFSGKVCWCLLIDTGKLRKHWCFQFILSFNTWNQCREQAFIWNLMNGKQRWAGLDTLPFGPESLGKLQFWGKELSFLHPPKHRNECNRNDLTQTSVFFLIPWYMPQFSAFWLLG